ncbi:glycoside hydrolase family 43 protein [Paenibacillus brevis]|uniref:Glycoside hydrolase family 43 protein n=1 Tax=Paenibacillus brevis TaxID=2841508 RepID=A0ABS6FQB0_9BACL|nr:glycoside hydrolase family 43 protein [Paenibacillus brevis]MBU5671638.1 glycoside hydrolase family 43 protein [Paenibacillus brevis]
MTISNPILKGFNPDPSIVRAGDDYYIATSTFEWFPGVQLHHSKDLVHWELIGHPLGERRLLDMSGNPNSGGIWAPCLSYHEGVFYLIYTDVKSLAGAFKDTPNYLTTATDIRGPWSDPVYLNSSGFDPSLFHDDDGRKWLVNLIWDHRKNRNPFHGIVLQEYSEAEQKLVGPKKVIFRGTELGCTEGPHIYKRNGWYYLMVAEGGTGYEHAVTVARSRSLSGPYEVDPANPVLTSQGNPDLPLQKAGHASLVETQNGEWYMVHLCSRPLPGLQQSPLGRETGIQQCEWTEDGWIRPVNGRHPQANVQSPALPSAPALAPVECDHFDGTSLDVHYSTLREPAEDSWLSLTERPGNLRLYGRQSLNSHFSQSLVAKRIQHFRFEAETVVEFDPEHFQQMAGLVCYYNSKNYYYLRISHDEKLGKTLNVLISDNGAYDELLAQDLPIRDWGGRCYLKVQIQEHEVRFFASPDGESWTAVGDSLPFGHLSDEYATRHVNGFFTDWGFTGAFVGLCVQDLSGEKKAADFDYFCCRNL